MSDRWEIERGPDGEIVRVLKWGRSHADGVEVASLAAEQERAQICKWLRRYRFDDTALDFEFGEHWSGGSDAFVEEP